MSKSLFLFKENGSVYRWFGDGNGYCYVGSIADATSEKDRKKFIKAYGSIKVPS